MEDAKERAYAFVGVVEGVGKVETFRRSGIEGALATLRVGEHWGSGGGDDPRGGKEAFAGGEGNVGSSLRSSTTKLVRVGRLLPRGSL